MPLGGFDVAICEIKRLDAVDGGNLTANVLNSERAVQASVQVIRAFIKLREVLASSSDLARKLDESPSSIPLERIEKSILLIRGERVMLDSDLAELYEVETKVLNRAVKRNPADFMFQLDSEEAAGLRFQFGTSKARGGRRYRPYVFTEQGVAMLSSVLSITYHFFFPSAFICVNPRPLL